MAEVKRRRSRKPMTIARVLAGSDRAELVERAPEAAQVPGTESMLLVWQDAEGEVCWRNAGMSNGAILWAMECIKREMFEDADG